MHIYMLSTCAVARIRENGWGLTRPLTQRKGSPLVSYFGGREGKWRGAAIVIIITQLLQFSNNRSNSSKTAGHHTSITVPLTATVHTPKKNSPRVYSWSRATAVSSEVMLGISYSFVTKPNYRTGNYEARRRLGMHAITKIDKTLQLLRMY